MRTLVGWGLFAVMAPCPVRVLPAQERTTVGGYGEVHYANPTGPKTPPVVNLARFVVYLAHSFELGPEGQSIIEAVCQIDDETGEVDDRGGLGTGGVGVMHRSEEHTSELQSP